MKTPISRLKLTLTLTWSFYLPAIWVLALSSSPLLASMGIPKLLAWGLLMSFGAAYAVTLYISAVRQGDKQERS
jgi:hypothetical protein